MKHLLLLLDYTLRVFKDRLCLGKSSVHLKSIKMHFLLEKDEVMGGGSISMECQGGLFRISLL